MHHNVSRPARRLSTLYAIPTPLGSAPHEALPAPAIEQIRRLKHFVVENAKSARAFLGALGMPVRELVIEEIGDNRRLTGGDIGLLSEAGCPAIADPARRTRRAISRLRARWAATSMSRPIRYRKFVIFLFLIGSSRDYHRPQRRARQTMISQLSLEVRSSLA